MHCPSLASTVAVTSGPFYGLFVPFVPSAPFGPVLVRAARESKCKIGTKLLRQVTRLILVYFLCGSYIGAGNYAKDNFEFKLILFYFFD